MLVLIIQLLYYDRIVVIKMQYLDLFRLNFGFS